MHIFCGGLLKQHFYKTFVNIRDYALFGAKKKLYYYCGLVVRVLDSKQDIRVFDPITDDIFFLC